MHSFANNGNLLRLKLKNIFKWQKSLNEQRSSWRHEPWTVNLFVATTRKETIPLQWLQRWGLPHANKDSKSVFVCPRHPSCVLLLLQLCILHGNNNDERVSGFISRQALPERVCIAGDSQQQKQEQCNCGNSYTWSPKALIICCYKSAFSCPCIQLFVLLSVCTWCADQYRAVAITSRKHVTKHFHVAKKYCAQWQLKGSRCLTHDLCSIFIGFTQRDNCAIAIVNIIKA